jgi:hypothetical protein
MRAHGSDPDAWTSLFVAEADMAAILVGCLSCQVHTARTPSSVDEQAPLRVTLRKGAAQRPTTRVGPPRTINTASRRAAASRVDPARSRSCRG